MRRPASTAAARPAAARSHSLPLFDGAASRRHVDVPLWKVRLAALPRPGLRPSPALDRVESLLQFVGFPRSGHSLVGALIDAHPDAVIAHELDAMGLFRAGLRWPQIARLIVRNADAFAREGKWWNGYRYAVEGAPPPSAHPRVIGDKKGDWAARWCARTPDLLERLAASGAPRPRWLLVTRAPADNIATMTLRRGGAYDRIRIAAAQGGVAAGAALDAAQADGTLAREADDEMIADYRALCTAIAGMKAEVPAGNWLDVDYDAFARDPTATLERIARFAELDPDPDWLAASAKLVRAGGSRSRERLHWRDDQRRALEALERDFPFLRPAEGSA